MSSYVEKMLMQKSAFDNGFRDEVEQEWSGMYFFKNPITGDYFVAYKYEGKFTFSVHLNVDGQTFNEVVTSTEELWTFLRNNLKKVRNVKFS